MLDLCCAAVNVALAMLLCFYFCPAVCSCDLVLLDAGYAIVDGVLARCCRTFVNARRAMLL